MDDSHPIPVQTISSSPESDSTSHPPKLSRPFQSRPQSTQTGSSRPKPFGSAITSSQTPSRTPLRPSASQPTSALSNEITIISSSDDDDDIVPIATYRPPSPSGSRSPAKSGRGGTILAPPVSSRTRSEDPDIIFTGSSHPSFSSLNSQPEIQFQSQSQRAPDISTENEIELPNPPSPPKPLFDFSLHDIEMEYGEDLDASNQQDGPSESGQSNLFDNVDLRGSSTPFPATLFGGGSSSLGTSLFQNNTASSNSRGFEPSLFAQSLNNATAGPSSQLFASSQSNPNPSTPLFNLESESIVSPPPLFPTFKDPPSKAPFQEPGREVIRPPFRNLTQGVQPSKPVFTGSGNVIDLTLDSDDEEDMPILPQDQDHPLPSQEGRASPISIASTRQSKSPSPERAPSAPVPLEPVSDAAGVYDTNGVMDEDDQPALGIDDVSMPLPREPSPDESPLQGPSPQPHPEEPPPPEPTFEHPMSDLPNTLDKGKGKGKGKGKELMSGVPSSSRDERRGAKRLKITPSNGSIVQQDTVSRSPAISKSPPKKLLRPSLQTVNRPYTSAEGTSQPIASTSRVTLSSNPVPSTSSSSFPNHRRMAPTQSSSNRKEPPQRLNTSVEDNLHRVKKGLHAGRSSHDIMARKSIPFNPRKRPPPLLPRKTSRRKPIGSFTKGNVKWPNEQQSSASSVSSSSDGGGTDDSDSAPELPNRRPARGKRKTIRKSLKKSGPRMVNNDLESAAPRRTIRPRKSIFNNSIARMRPMSVAPSSTRSRSKPPDENENEEENEWQSTSDGDQDNEKDDEESDASSLSSVVASTPQPPPAAPIQEEDNDIELLSSTAPLHRISKLALEEASEQDQFLIPVSRKSYRINSFIARRGRPILWRNTRLTTALTEQELRETILNRKRGRVGDVDRLPDIKSRSNENVRESTSSHPEKVEPMSRSFAVRVIGCDEGEDGDGKKRGACIPETVLAPPACPFPGCYGGQFSAANKEQIWTAQKLVFHVKNAHTDFDAQLTINKRDYERSLDDSEPITDDADISMTSPSKGKGKQKAIFPDLDPSINDHEPTFVVCIRHERHNQNALQPLDEEPKPNISILTNRVPMQRRKRLAKKSQGTESREPFCMVRLAHVSHPVFQRIWPLPNPRSTGTVRIPKTSRKGRFDNKVEDDEDEHARIPAGFYAVRFGTKVPYFPNEIIRRPDDGPEALHFGRDLEWKNNDRDLALRKENQNLKIVFLKQLWTRHSQPWNIAGKNDLAECLRDFVWRYAGVLSQYEPYEPHGSTGSPQGCLLQFKTMLATFVQQGRLPTGLARFFGEWWFSYSLRRCNAQKV